MSDSGDPSVWATKPSRPCERRMGQTPHARFTSEKKGRLAYHIAILEHSGRIRHKDISGKHLPPLLPPTATARRGRHGCEVLNDGSASELNEWRHAIVRERR